MDKTIHPAQNEIFRQLLFTREASYSSLRKSTRLESDHFKFHIARCLELGHVLKNLNGTYSLTTSGKEYANKLDTDIGKIERQPKSAVIIVVQNIEGLFLFQQRKKHPYFDFWGYPGGKIRWGETILEAGERELKEETNLIAELSYCGVYHELVRNEKTNDIIEDKIFHVLGGKNPGGVMKKSFEGGINEWMRIDELMQKEKRYASCDIETSIGRGEKTFIEMRQTIKEEAF